MSTTSSNSALLNDLGTLPPEQQQVAQQDLRILGEQMEQAEQAATEQGIAWPPDKLVTTKMIKEATALAFPGDGDNDVLLRERATFLWRTASAHAHGTLSSRRKLIRVENVTIHSNGLATGKPEASLTNISTMVISTAVMTAVAWQLYDSRRLPCG